MNADWQKLGSIVLNELNKWSEEQSCIMAAAVFLSVLRAIGVKNAYPLTVKAKIFYPKFTQRPKNEPYPNTTKLEAQWIAEGCHGINLGYVEGSDAQWPGHLVVIIPNVLNGRDAMYDLTIAQANKPEWDIQLSPILAGVRDSFIKGKENFGVTMNGCQIVYKAFPENHSFMEAPAWKGKLKSGLMVKRVLKRLLKT